MTVRCTFWLLAHSLIALFCSEQLAQGGSGVRAQVEATGSATLVWCGTQAVLTSAGAVSAQELQPLVVHSVEGMHASQRALLGEQQPLAISQYPCMLIAVFVVFGLALERKLEHGQVTVRSHSTNRWRSTHRITSHPPSPHSPLCR